MSFILLFFVSFIYANPSTKWNSAIIKEKHEFYQNYELINKPKNTWQLLFAVEYKDVQLQIKKDCLFYRVPGDELGRLKIISIAPEKKCHDFIFQEAKDEWPDLKALQFAIEEHRIFIQLTHKNFELETWDFPMLSIFKNPSPKFNLSSAEFRAPKIIFLKSQTTTQGPVKLDHTKTLKDGEICHSIAEDCKEITKSDCMNCPNGWFEIPNGCPQSPKYCGIHLCGLKNRPACRRGRHYTGLEKKFDCRTDSSFAYCSKGLMIQCQGNLAYCI
jgi:hypothetical protein